VGDTVEALASGVDAARALGADADARCEAARGSMEGARRAATDALARLAP
jgi:hypothetical protein